MGYADTVNLVGLHCRVEDKEDGTTYNHFGKIKYISDVEIVLERHDMEDLEDNYPDTLLNNLPQRGHVIADCEIILNRRNCTYIEIYRPKPKS